MSQSKVDKYKEYKKNRKEILAKEKRQAMIARIASIAAIVVLCLAILGGIGMKVYLTRQEKLAAMPDYKTTQLEIPDYSGILADEE